MENPGNVYTKFIVTCEVKEPNCIGKLLGRIRRKFEIYAPYAIWGFRNMINTRVYNILSIEPTSEQMEVFGNPLVPKPFIASREWCR